MMVNSVKGEAKHMSYGSLSLLGRHVDLQRVEIDDVSQLKINSTTEVIC